MLTLEKYSRQRAVQLTDKEYGIGLKGPLRLKARGQRETSCRVDYESGELLCWHVLRAPGKLDCRQPWCHFREVMRQRVEARLRQKRLALSLNKPGGR